MKKNKKDFCVQNAANFITLLNMIFGSCSILASMNGRYSWAIAFIGFSAIADRYDGIVARKLKTDSELGVQMDSMGDIISFGVAPAVLTYLSIFSEFAGKFRLIGGLAMVFYIAAGAFRLARYNVQGLNDDHSYSGLPITIAGTVLILSMLFKRSLHPIVYLVLMIVLAALEISKISIKKR